MLMRRRSAFFCNRLLAVEVFPQPLSARTAMTKTAIAPSGRMAHFRSNTGLNLVCWLVITLAGAVGVGTALRSDWTLNFDETEAGFFPGIPADISVSPS